MSEIIYPNSHILAKINDQLEQENRKLREQLAGIKAELYSLKQKRPINLDEKVFENILNEIDQDEKQQQNKPKHSKNINQQTFIWEKINHCLRTHNINYLKDLITQNDINLDQKDSRHKNMTLLMKTCIFGNYDIAELLIHSQANAYLLSEEKCSAYDYAEKCANYHIAQLLKCEDLATSLGSQVQNKIDTLHRQNGITKCALEKLDETTLNGIVELMMYCVNNKLPFSDDMMHIAWNYSQSKNIKLSDSPLFQLLLTTYSKIINDITNIRHWSWLQNYLIPSTIWLNTYPHDNTRTLFNELFIGAEKANDKLSVDILLKNINKMKKKHNKLWRELKKFQV
eukprot:69618_1